MSSIVRAADLLPEELEMLGENIRHAVEHDDQERVSSFQADSPYRAPDGVAPRDMSSAFPNPFPRPAA